MSSARTTSPTAPSGARTASRSGATASGAAPPLAYCMASSRVFWSFASLLSAGGGVRSVSSATAASSLRSVEAEPDKALSTSTAWSTLPNRDTRMSPSRVVHCVSKSFL